MTFHVIDNPNLQKHMGFTNAQFRQLDGLYMRAVSYRILNHRTVDCDFDEGLLSYSYHITEHQPPFLQFLIRKVGPQTLMYEVYKQGKGRIAKSGLFQRAFDKCAVELESLRQAD